MYVNFTYDDLASCNADIKNLGLSHEQEIKEKSNWDAFELIIANSMHLDVLVQRWI